MTNLTAPSGKSQVILESPGNPSGLRQDNHAGRTEYRSLVLLGAFCIFLSALDHLIPKPLPFMRIGLANLPLLLALDFFSVKYFFLLVLVKVLGQGLISGTLFSYVALFSFAGTFLSASLMFFLRRIVKKNSFVGISIAGAFASNAAQLVLARFIVFGEGVIYLVPPFLAAGIISGGIFGFIAEQFSAQSKWLSLKRKGTAAAVIPTDAAVETRSEKPAAYPLFRGLVLFVLIVFFLLVPHLMVRTALFLLFWFFAFLSGKETRPLFTIIGILMIILCNLFPPYGRIVFSYGPLIITEENVLRGLQRAVTMEGLVMFSLLTIGSNLPLQGSIGRLLRETFAVLELLNRNFAGRKTGESKESLFQKLDRLLCEMSGYS